MDYIKKIVLFLSSLTILFGCTKDRVFNSGGHMTTGVMEFISYDAAASLALSEPITFPSEEINYINLPTPGLINPIYENKYNFDLLWKVENNNIVEPGNYPYVVKLPITLSVAPGYEGKYTFNAETLSNSLFINLCGHWPSSPISYHENIIPSFEIIEEASSRIKINAYFQLYELDRALLLNGMGNLPDPDNQNPLCASYEDGDKIAITGRPIFRLLEPLMTINGISFSE